MYFWQYRLFWNNTSFLITKLIANFIHHWKFSIIYSSFLSLLYWIFFSDRFASETQFSNNFRAAAECELTELTVNHFLGLIVQTWTRLKASRCGTWCTANTRTAWQRSSRSRFLARPKLSFSNGADRRRGPLLTGFITVTRSRDPPTCSPEPWSISPLMLSEVCFL